MEYYKVGTANALYSERKNKTTPAPAGNNKEKKMKTKRTEHEFSASERKYPFLAVSEKECPSGLVEMDKEAQRRAEIFAKDRYVHAKFWGYRQSGGDFFGLYEIKENLE